MNPCITTTPEHFRKLCRRELERYQPIEAFSVASTSSDPLADRAKWRNGYIGEVPNPRVDICFSLSESFPLPDSKRQGVVRVGVEYHLQLDPSTFDQDHRLQTSRPHGILVYERTGLPPHTLRDLEYAQVFFDLDSERVTYAGYNRFAQRVIPKLLSIEGLNLEEGVKRFFKMIPKE